MGPSTGIMRYEKSLAIQSRHDRLVELIRAGEFASPDLAQKLGVSEQTIYRDIEFLKQRGFFIRSEKHTDGWAYHLLAKAATDSSEKGEALTRLDQNGKRKKGRVRCFKAEEHNG